MPPFGLRYNRVRDEIVFLHQFWGSSDGAMGIWRINQKNEPREVLRFITKGALSTPSSNLVAGKFAGVEHGFSVDPQGTIWFAAASSGAGYPSQDYQVVDSIKTLKKPVLSRHAAPFRSRAWF